MFNFHQKRKLRTIINSPYTRGGILLLALMVGWSAYVRYDIAAQMADRRTDAAGQAAALEARRDALLEQVEYLSNDRGIEAEMRRQFDVALEGEQVVVIVDDESEEEDIQPLSGATSTVPEKRWYQFWR